MGAVVVDVEERGVRGKELECSKATPLIGKGVNAVVDTAEAMRNVATEGWHFGRRALNAGKPVRVCFLIEEEDRTLRQNAFYWGAVLRDISEQALVCGQRWTAEAWHELFKRQFLGYRVRKVSVAGRKRKLVLRQLRSTKELTVKQMGTYLEKVQAFGAVDLGVRFRALHWEDWHDDMDH